MAPTMFDSTQTLFQQLEQTKQSFWSSHAHLSEEQRHELWVQAAFQPRNVYTAPRTSMAHQTPRSLPSTSNMVHFPVWTTLLVCTLLSF
jgi:hypothetical protein